MKALARLLEWKPGIDGRVVVIASLACYLGIVAVGRLLWEVDLWPALGVPSGPSLFFDARNLTAAWECHRLGYDPLYESPCDPWQRPLMYPRLWLALGMLGLDQSHTFVLAVVLIAAMFLSFLLLVGRVTGGTGVVLACAACSPAVMLAVERANMDVALFSILASAALLWRAWPRAATLISPLLMLVAAAAKIYPVFALPAFLFVRSPRGSAVGVLCLTAFAAYVAISIDDFVQVATIATQGQHYSYGARILMAHIYHQFLSDSWAAPAALKQAVAAGATALCAAAVVIPLWRRPRVGWDAAADGALALGFYSGALIYLGTFVAANNFDYRLVFLLLTLPQLVAWTRQGRVGGTSLAAPTLLAVLVLLWVGSLSRPLGLWDELASWAVAALLVAILGVTMPAAEETRVLLRRALQRTSYDPA